MIRKLLKICLIGCAIIAILNVAAFFTLKKMYPPQKLKAMATQYVAQKLHREISFDDISFTWIGFTFTNVALSENTTFQNGTFAQAKRITAHVAVKPLLQKRIEIGTIEADGLQINVIENKDGSFNFDTLIPDDTSNPAPTTTENTDEEVTSSFVFTAEKIKLTDCDIVYLDQQTGLRTALNALNIEINDFDADEPFDAIISFTTDISGTNQPDMSLPVVIKARTFLANYNMAQAYTTITNASVKYKTVALDITGDIKNFEKPALNLTGKLTGITNHVLSDFAPGLPNFSLPTIDLSLQAITDYDNQITTLKQAKLEVQNSSLSTQGTIQWNGPTPTYNLTGSLVAIIDQLVLMTNTLDGFKPTGTIRSTFKASEKKDFTDITGTISLKDVSIWYDPFVLTQLNGNVVLNSLDNISSSALTGKLNNENFKASFSYKMIKNIMDIVLNLNLDKLTLDKFSSSTQEQTTTAASSQKDAAADATAQTTPMNIQANVQIGEITIPYFYSKGLTLAANLTNITDSMAHANGTIDFTLQPGKITNLDNFIKDNKTAKILLLPVAAIKKVASFLKLNLFPKPDPKQGTAIAFTEGAGNYTFADGLMTINKTVFNSSVTKISASGTANFQTDALDMKAKATLLTQAAPVSIKITGTMTDPKGKLDVVNTVTSVVGGILNGRAEKSAANGGATLTKNVAKTTAKTVKGTVNTTSDLVKGIGSLFKKSKAEQED